MQTTSKRISELKVGDIVHCHGMRCLIDQPLQVSKAHPSDGPGGLCRWTKALVLNRDDVPTHWVPWSFTADWKRNAGNAPLPHDGEHRWSIQSNELYSWAVEIPSAD